MKMLKAIKKEKGTFAVCNLAGVRRRRRRKYGACRTMWCATLSRHGSGEEEEVQQPSSSYYDAPAGCWPCAVTCFCIMCAGSVSSFPQRQRQMTTTSDTTKRKKSIKMAAVAHDFFFKLNLHQCHFVVHSIPQPSNSFFLFFLRSNRTRRRVGFRKNSSFGLDES